MRRERQSRLKIIGPSLGTLIERILQRLGGRRGQPLDRGTVAGLHASRSGVSFNLSLAKPGSEVLLSATEASVIAAIIASTTALP